MTANKTSLTETEVHADDRQRTRNSDVVPSGSAAPARARSRVHRVFSLPVGLMRSAREACGIVAQRAHARGRVRVWVPVCKTGSTAYTISMLLFDAAGPLAPLELTVFATDTDERALALARRGRYPARAALGMDPGLRARYTFDEDETIRVSERMRESCFFSRHDITRDPPFPRLDLIVCDQIFHGVAAPKRAVLAQRLRCGLRHDGLLLACDHRECFPLELFEPAGPGCFRPREQRRPMRACLPPRQSAHEPTTFRKRLDSARAALVPRRVASDECGNASDFIRRLGHALLVCDGQLRVLVMSVEAQRLFELPSADQTLELAALTQGLPGGPDVVSAARRVVAGRDGQDVIMRKGPSTYLAQARPGFSGRGVAITFTDVTPFEAAATRASQQQDRQAALARLRKLALRLADPSGLYQEAYAALTHHVPGCAAAIVLEQVAPGGELEVRAAWGLGADPMSTLRGLAGSRRWIEEAMATGRVVSHAISPPEPVEDSPESVAPQWFVASASFAASRSFAAAQPAAGSPGWTSRASPSSALERGMASRLIDGGEVVGALVLFGSSRSDEAADEDFLREVAGAVGDGIGRCRLQRRLELEGRHEHAELEALYTALPVAVSLHDQAGALVRTNRALAPSEAGGTELDAGEEAQRERGVLRRLYAEEMPGWIERALATGEPLRDVELRVLQDDERQFWRCNFVPLRGADGGVTAVSAIAQDVTALKRVEALRDADRRKDDFIALLGHELRNPIAAIRNATELLARLEQPTPQLRRLQGIYERQTSHTAKLLDGLLDVARVARGKIRLHRTPLAVVELVRRAVDDRRAQFQARRIELQLADDELWVSADRVRMLQIVDNLLSNALKFTSEAGSIRVEVARGAETGEIVIDDDGAGIEPDALPFIFEPFWQARPSAEATGLGLGLALVRGLAQLHGFRIRAESEGRGRGASYRLMFPLIEAPEADAPPSQVAHRELDLMLVEDNGDVSETMAELLAADGHRVEVASTAEHALERLGARRVDVVLVDIGLPGMSGLELAARLRQDPVLSSMRLVALTGFGDAATERRMLAAGFDRYLLKPVRFEALRDCLARLWVGEGSIRA